MSSGENPLGNVWKKYWQHRHRRRFCNGSRKNPIFSMAAINFKAKPERDLTGTNS